MSALCCGPLITTYYLLHEVNRVNHHIWSCVRTYTSCSNRNAASRTCYACNSDAVNEGRRDDYASNRQRTREGLSEHAATFSTEQITDKTNFEDHQNNIETAAMLFHHNNGLMRFSLVEDLQSEDETSCSTAREELLKEISRQKLSLRGKSNLVAKYLQMQGTGGYHGATYGKNRNSHSDAITCASCGIRTLMKIYTLYVHQNQYI